MLSDKIQAALNQQMNAELYSSYLYLSMAAYFEAENYNGFSRWMTLQSQEEYGHAMKIYSYINQAGGRVELDAIEKPQMHWTNAQLAFENALEHEVKVTNMINDLMDLTIEEKDHATNIFLHWFVEEQVEEVDTARQIVDRLKMIDGHQGAMFIYDRELGSRQAGQ